jgi:hypothetical protein
LHSNEEEEFQDIGNFLCKSILTEDKDTILRVIPHSNATNITLTPKFEIDAVFGLIDNANAIAGATLGEIYFKKFGMLSKTKLNYNGRKIHEYPHLSIGRIDKRYHIYAVFPHYRGSNDTELHTKFLQKILFPAIQRISDVTVKSKFPLWPSDMPFHTFQKYILSEPHFQVVTVTPIFWDKLIELDDEFRDTELFFLLYFEWPGQKLPIPTVASLETIHNTITSQINPQFCGDYLIDIRASLFAEVKESPELPLAVIWNADEVLQLFQLKDNREAYFRKPRVAVGDEDEEEEILPPVQLDKVRFDQYPLYGTSIFRDVWGKIEHVTDNFFFGYPFFLLLFFP